MNRTPFVALATGYRVKGSMRYPPSTVSNGDGHLLFSESSSVFGSPFELVRESWRVCRRVSSLRRLLIVLKSNNPRSRCGGTFR
jgi:hypothetical protein